MKFLFKYPTMGRPDWFKETLKTYQKMLSGKNEYQFIVSLNFDDESMLTPDMIKFLNEQPNLEFYTSDHKSKIEACNADIEGRDFDILFLISDDMIPIVQDFDLIISKSMQEHFPDLDGAVWFNDGLFGEDRTITLSILGKKLYDYFGYIYHPDYKSFYCDNEFTDCVLELDKVHYFEQVIVKHEWTGGPKGDNTYRKNSKLGKPDKATYNRRKSINFPRRIHVHPA